MDAKEKDIAEKFLHDAAEHARKGNYDMLSIDANSVRYALRAIEERRELLAALKLQVGGEYTEKVGCVCYACAARALIAKCEAP